MRLNGQMLAETYRNTLATWLAHDIDIAPLGRWDTILISVGLLLTPDYEAWERETYGDLSYIEDPAILGNKHQTN